MILLSLSLVLLIFEATATSSFYKEESLTNEERSQLASMGAKIANMNPSNYYNYFLMCLGATSRVNVKSMLVHKTVPSEYYDQILNTLHGSYNRKNKCPKWSSPNIHTRPESGPMERLVLDEATPVGQVVYLLSALDPERQPLFYFLRPAETEPQMTSLFSVRQIKIGENWYGEVRLARPLTSQPKNELTYLVNVFDGLNILEQVSKIDLIRRFPSNGDNGPLINSTVDETPYPMSVELVRSKGHIRIIDKQVGDSQSSMLFLLDTNSSSQSNSNSPVAANSSSFELFFLLFKIAILALVLLLIFFSFYLFFSF